MFRDPCVKLHYENTENERCAWSRESPRCSAKPRVGAVLGVITKNVSASSLYVRINVVFIYRKETKMFIEEIQHAGIVFKGAVTFFYLDLQSYCC